MKMGKSELVRFGVPGQGLRSKPQGRQKLKIQIEIRYIQCYTETVGVIYKRIGENNYGY
jgi:hypothetical protein